MLDGVHVLGLGLEQNRAARHRCCCWLVTVGLLPHRALLHARIILVCMCLLAAAARCWWWGWFAAGIVEVCTWGLVRCNLQPSPPPHPILPTHPPYRQLLVESKRLGEKTGSGFYKYDARRRASPDPSLAPLVAQSRKVGGWARATHDMLLRCVFVASQTPAWRCWWRR